MAYHRKLALVDDRTGLIVMASLFCLIQLLVITLRIYARRLRRMRYGTDDWLAIIAVVFVLGLNGVFLAGTIQGAITGHSQVVDDWPVTSPLEHLAQKYKYAFQTTEKITFGLIKLSILFLWKRMISPIRWFQVSCWVMIGVVIAWMIAFFFATVFQCYTQWAWNWAPISFFLTQCTNTLDMLTVFTATDIVTDVIIITMPVPIIWQLHLPTIKKVGLTGLFMMGLFTIGAGIARMYIYLVTSYDKEDNPDFIADFTLFMLWSAIEVNVGMIVCSMPVCAPVVSKFRDCIVIRLGSKGSSHLSHQRGKGSKEYLTDRSENPYFGDKTSSYEMGAYRTTIASREPMDEINVEGPLETRSGIVVRTRISNTFE
ncbi:hypothetical protein BO78DRAFT_422270 [Aspergillus sclerotiicarbonarius CBS 121057]|uniref:Rhodopsin domain-containing protein n=1 Tax=Aspergillus sclerotiicarbonarius (strain CBS 121057 / IBT 28362) TaxID=1448318 RepID=A0A319DY55_ASPSB|nr:hypothetical protein BO78DRAFT_422270 [Aspergillus sclerotiicarbonarius CBS 121057]